jgi:hypothetical protein
MDPNTICKLIFSFLGPFQVNDFIEPLLHFEMQISPAIVHLFNSVEWYSNVLLSVTQFA